MSRKVCLVRTNDKTERAIGQCRKNKRGDSKGESNDSPGIPGRGVFPVGGGGGRRGEGGVSPPDVPSGAKQTK